MLDEYPKYRTDLSKVLHFFGLDPHFIYSTFLEVKGSNEQKHTCGHRSSHYHY